MMRLLREVAGQGDVVRGIMPLKGVMIDLLEGDAVQGVDRGRHR